MFQIILYIFLDNDPKMPDKIKERRLGKDTLFLHVAPSNCQAVAFLKLLFNSCKKMSLDDSGFRCFVENDIRRRNYI